LNYQGLLIVFMKVSVIIPAYNSSATIKVSLESAINQSYPIYEIIIVNDGSTDHTEDIIKQIMEENPNADIHYVYKKNGGPSVSRNFALQIAQGDLIAFLDSDDIWLEDKIERQVKVFENNPEIFLIGGLYKKGNLPVDHFKEITFKELLLSNRFFTSATIVRKEVFNTIPPFKETMKYSEDYNLWLRILAEYRGGILNQQVFKYATDSGINNNGLSGNLWLMEKGELQNFNEMYKLNHISFVKLQLLRLFSIAKYIRRRIKKVLNRL